MKKLLLAVSILFLLTACSTQTKITGSWANNTTPIPKDFKKIGVIVISSNSSNQKTIESTFVDRLQQMGYNAIETSSFLVPSVVKKENKALIESMMKERDVDALIVLSLLQVQNETHYVPGTNPYAPGAYYNGYFGYYYYNYNLVNQPGYYENTKSIFLESNFYDLTENKLVSSIQTKTVNPANVDQLSLSFSKTILKKLISDNILEVKNK